MKTRKSEFKGCIEEEVWFKVPKGDWGLCWYTLGKWTANPLWVTYEYCIQVEGGNYG